MAAKTSRHFYPADRSMHDEPKNLKKCRVKPFRYTIYIYNELVLALSCTKMRYRDGRKWQHVARKMSVDGRR
jgi:hypothetical protein